MSVVAVTQAWAPLVKSLKLVEMIADDSIDDSETWEDDLELEKNFASLPPVKESIWRKRSILLTNRDWQLSNWQTDTTVHHTLRKTWEFTARVRGKNLKEESRSACTERLMDGAVLEGSQKVISHKKVLLGVFGEVWNSFVRFPSFLFLMVGLMLILAIDFVHKSAIPAFKLGQKERRRDLGMTIEKKALVLMKEKDYVRAVEELHKGLEDLTIAEEVDSNDLAALTYLLAKAFMFLAKWSAAESCLYQVDEIYTFAGDDTGAALVYEDLSIVFEAQNRHDEAAKMRSRAKEINAIQSALYDDENSDDDDDDDEDEDEDEDEDSVWRTSPAKKTLPVHSGAAPGASENEEEGAAKAVLVEVPPVRAYSLDGSLRPAPAYASSPTGAIGKQLSHANKENEKENISTPPPENRIMASTNKTLDKARGFEQGGRRRAKSGLSPRPLNVIR